MTFHPDRNWLRRFRSAVPKWYDDAGRDLPWRATRDPYAVWISEVMLQQTTVAAVRPYFERFLERFPDVTALANSDEADVLRLWEGLGYYSRGRNLHRAARVVVERFGGTFPQDVDELRSLPGVGRYTAGAIASFAFDIPAGIVEANTVRLYARLMGYDGDPRSTAGQRALWEFAETIVPKRNAGAFNHALMDLGATVCTIAEPRCESCPVRSCCTAFADGRQAEIPPPKKRTKITDVTEASVAVEKQGKFLLRQRGEGERWAGLWDFPRFEVPGDAVAPNSDRPTVPAELANVLVDGVREAVGVTCAVDALVTEIRHGVTRFRIRLLCLRGRHVSGRLPPRSPTAWVAPRDFGEYPLSTTGRQFAEILAAGDDGRSDDT